MITRLTRRRLTVWSLLLFAVPVLGDTAQANAALQHGQVDLAERSLRATLVSSPNDAFAHLLLCRVFYAQERPESAIPECEAAAARAPLDSDTQMWLGRAYGARASRANPLLAFELARKVRSAFERAVQLKPSNLAAASDLGEFYVAAPAIVGGGLDKAVRLATNLHAQSPAAAHRLLAYVAQARKDPRTAESEFKLAVASAPTPDAYMDLAQFYQQHGQPDQAVAALTMGILLDRARSPALVDAASILIAMHRNPDQAERALRDYLASSAQSDAAPTFKVHLQLGRLLAAHGDRPGAQRELAAALTLAPNFAPARDAMKGA